jgi:beta-galactosidase
VGANADLSPYDILVIGKNALTLNGLAPDVSGVRDGLKVIVFEQTGEVLERRFGFRMAEYGMRWLFKRVPDSPLLAGLDDVLLRNWRGDATVLPPRFDLDVTETGHTVRWCDIPVTRAWRCGNRGNAASATIEKPACGDFLPILDGGYAFQYAALMEYREGDGMVMFCQTDVTGRTESDAAAQTLARNLLQYVADWKPSARRGVAYAGGLAGRAHLESAGLTLSAFGAGLSDDEVLVLTPGAGKELAGKATAIRKWLKAGGRALAIGLEAKEANAVLSTKIATRKAEHIATCFEAFGADSPFAGVSPAEVHNRDPRKLPLVKAGARVVGNGVLAEAARANVVFCQLAPWEFDYSRERMNNKRTFRKTSNLLARLLGNMGASGATRLLEHIGSPVAQGETRWLDGLYLDVPEEWDDPYRFFRW